MSSTPKGPPPTDDPDVPIFITDPSFRLPHEDWELWRQRTKANDAADMFVKSLVESGFKLSEHGTVRVLQDSSFDPEKLQE